MAGVLAARLDDGGVGDAGHRHPRRLEQGLGMRLVEAGAHGLRGAAGIGQLQPLQHPGHGGLQARLAADRFDQVEDDVRALLAQSVDDRLQVAADRQPPFGPAGRAHGIGDGGSYRVDAFHGQTIALLPRDQGLVVVVEDADQRG